MQKANIYDELCEFIMSLTDDEAKNIRTRWPEILETIEELNRGGLTHERTEN